jgi:cytochrome c553
MQFRLSALLGSLLLISLTGVADAGGDAARGKVLSYTCQGCHGIPNYKNAAPSYSVPKVGGQQAAYLIAALKEYASGDRAHPTMHAHAASNSDQDREDMAAFFQGQGALQSAVVGTPPAAVQVCAACHGADGRPVLPEYPNLAGQHADYIVQALKDYKAGKRKNAVMAGIVSSVKDEDIPAIANFYASQNGLCDIKEIYDNGKCK